MPPTQFADDTTVVGLIDNNDETAYRKDVGGEGLRGVLLGKHQQNEGEGELHITEMIHPHRQCGEESTKVSFLPQETEEIWLDPGNLTNFNRCTIESMLPCCITVWYGNCTFRNCRALQRVARSAQRITGGTLTGLQDTYST
jgi:hypothetical protein